VICHARTLLFDSAELWFCCHVRRERAKSMGEAGRKRVEELFSLSAFAKRLDDVLKDVVFNK
jgi:hypothetical protein